MLKTVGNERNGVLGILLPNKEHNIPNRILENSDYCEVISMPTSANWTWTSNRAKHIVRDLT